jgi:UDP-N-acetylenolpyruvoylglucosamine reductase
MGTSVSPCLQAILQGICQGLEIAVELPGRVGAGVGRHLGAGVRKAGELERRLAGAYTRPLFGST